MDMATGAIGVAAAGLAVAAAALARAGRRQRSHRGWPWWVGAAALGAVGLPLAAWAPPLPPALVQALLLLWPVCTLIGVRRFHARLGLPGDGRVDAAAFGLAAAACALLPGAAVLGLHLYVAALLWSARTPEDAGALRLLGATVALAALPPALAPWLAMPPPVAAQALGSAAALWVVAFVTLTLMGERTERELRESRRRLRVLANTDPLTQVPNRRHFNELAARVLGEAAADEAAPVLLLLDIDHFKLINDKLGHPAGDRALRLVGRCIAEALRAGDLAGRLGGDEFALMLGGASLTQAIGVADRIVQQVQVRSPEQRLPALTLSFGLVQVRPGESVDDALHRADRALYEAKRQGRSRAVAAHGGEDTPVFSESQRLGLTAL